MEKKNKDNHSLLVLRAEISRDSQIADITDGCYYCF